MCELWSKINDSNMLFYEPEKCTVEGGKADILVFPENFRVTKCFRKLLSNPL